MEYPHTFKAAVLEETNQSLCIRDVTFDGPLQLGQVMVQVHYSGICGKQIEEIHGTGGTDPYLPHLLGHEGTGVIVDVGPGVTKVEPGDRVVMHWLKGSGIQAETPTYHSDGRHMNAGWVTTFNQYGVVSENRVTKVPPGTDLNVACLLGCAVTTGLGVVLNEAKVAGGDSMAVFGCGGVGLSAIQGGRLAGADPIIAIDSNPDSLGLALKLGASHAVKWPSDDLHEEIAQITDGKGCRFVMVAVGAPQAIETGLQISSLPGSVFFIGVPPLGSTISVDPLDIHRGRTLLGSYGGGCVPERDIPVYLEFYERGQLKLGEMVSNTVTLETINDGIDFLRSGIAGRCVARIV